MLVALSWIVAFSARRINVGMEGQLIVEGIFATCVALYVPGLPAPLHLPLAILVGFELPPVSWRVGLGCVGWFVLYWAGHVVGGVVPVPVVPGVDPGGDVLSGLVSGLVAVS